MVYTWLQRLGRHGKEDTHPYIVLHNPLSHSIDPVFMSVADVGMIGDGDGEQMQVPLGSKGGRLWLVRAPLLPPIRARSPEVAGSKLGTKHRTRMAIIAPARVKLPVPL